MKISVNTKLMPLLGDPLTQSFSTKVTNEIFRLEGIDCLKIPVEVDGEHLADVVNGFRHMNIIGITVTKPNKMAVIRYLDDIDDIAEIIGAVNVITWKDGRLKGFNTDGEAFVRSLMEEESRPVEELRFFCFGAGGAGRAMCVALAHHGAKKIRVVDKVDDLGSSLAKSIGRHFDVDVGQVVSGDGDSLAENIEASDVIVNASGIGMYPHLEATPLDKGLLKPRHIAFDATYNPRMTRFLTDAASVGCKTINGKRMLVHAGALGYEILVGKAPPLKKWFELMDLAERGIL